MLYFEGFQETTVPIADTLEIYVATICALEGANWLPFPINVGLEVV